MKAIVLPENQNAKLFRAFSGKKKSYGKTVGEAVDALTEKLESNEQNTVVFVQDFEPDEFFTADQQQRMSILMSKWREARDAGRFLSSSEQTELEELIAAELDGSGRRVEKLANLLGK